MGVGFGSLFMLKKSKHQSLIRASHVVAVHFAMAREGCGTHSPKNPQDLISVEQVHSATSFLGAPWPVAISFVLGSQMRENIYSEDHKTADASNF